MILVRYTSLQLLAMSHPKCSNALQRSWTSVIWYDVMPLQVTPFMRSRSCLHNFIITMKSLFRPVFILMFLCHANTPLNTTHVLSVYLVHPMAYVRPWRSQSISRQWKNPGNAPANIRHYYRCFTQTPAWTRCFLHEGRLLSRVWWQVQPHHTPQCFLEVNNQQWKRQPTRKMTQMTWALSPVQKFYLQFSLHVLPIGSFFFPPLLITKLSL